MFDGDIFITPHTKKRFIQRRINVIRNGYMANPIRKMLNMLQRSSLIGCLTKEDGRLHEYREYKGCIFVCERQKTKSFWEKDLVTVITVKLTAQYIKTLIDRGYDVEQLELHEYMMEAM
ncbi:MAG: hypothetical protein H9893_01890 [Candidatus Niameybacter stercoravium]|nr:hypothetical protein [Candidatus Niameybacter stercoravium]